MMNTLKGSTYFLLYLIMNCKREYDKLAEVGKNSPAWIIAFIYIHVSVDGMQIIAN